MERSTGAPPDARAALDRITRAWLESRPGDIRPYLHPDVVMAYPGFAGRSRGADALIGGFEQFCREARIVSYTEMDHEADEVAGTSVVTLRWEMVYERGGASWRATGRDLWVFADQGEGPRAVWRTMLDVEEVPA